MTTPKVGDYRFGRVVIDGKVYRRDVIILPQGVKRNWRRFEGHSLAFEDLSWLPEERPLTLIIGTGAHGLVNVPEETRRQIEAEGIRLLAAPTAQACEAYNRLRLQEGVVAGLHLTC
ncbi:MAG: MTH938/NDUFAF3 family protein [Anaerolineales bacterium]